jgi:hypothetical protein
LAAERAGYQGAYNPAIGNASIANMYAASQGNVPSAADLQLQRQSDQNAAQQFGLAAALQGRNSGDALRQASQGAVATQAQTNAQLGIQRAQEQATARDQLAQALATQRGQDLGYQGNLLSAQIGALNAGTNAASAYGNAAATQAGAQNQYKGSLLQGGAGALGAIFSDRRGKKDVRKADLGMLASALKGYRFKYKDEANGPGERIGVMAQDVEKGGRIGRRIVQHRPDGKLQLDTGNAVGAALAMSAAALRATQKAA